MNTYKLENQSKGNVPIPWIAYGDDKKEPDAVELARLDQIYTEWMASQFQPPHVKRTRLSKILRFIAGTPSPRRIQMINFKAPSLSENENHRIRIARATCGCSFDEGSIAVYDTRLEITNIWFIANLATGLPAIIAWLKDNGCTDIRYTIRQEGEYE